MPLHHCSAHADLTLPAALPSPRLSTATLTAVSKAFTCLSDPEKRRHYDAYGREEGGGGNVGGGGRRGGGGFYRQEMEIDPEDLFNM